MTAPISDTVATLTIPHDEGPVVDIQLPKINRPPKKMTDSGLRTVDLACKRFVTHLLQGFGNIAATLRTNRLGS